MSHGSPVCRRVYSPLRPTTYPSGEEPIRTLVPLPDPAVANTHFRRLAEARQDAITSLTAVITNMEHIGVVEREALTAAEVRCHELRLECHAKQLRLDKLLAARVQDQRTLAALRQEVLALKARVGYVTNKGGWFARGHFARLPALTPPTALARRHRLRRLRRCPVHCVGTLGDGTNRASCGLE